MRGKIVNSIVGGMNLLFGLLVLFFNFYLPSISRASAEELKVITEINNYILALTIVVAIVNLITLLFDCVFLNSISLVTLPIKLTLFNICTPFLSLILVLC